MANHNSMCPAAKCKPIAHWVATFRILMINVGKYFLSYCIEQKFVVIKSHPDRC